MRYINKKYNLVFVGILAAIYNAITLSFPLALMMVTDSIISGDMYKFRIYIGIAIISVILRIIFHIILTWVEQRLIMHCMTDLKCGLLKGILSFKCSFFEASRPSQYSSFMMNDMRMLESHYFAQIISITKHISMLIFACFSIFLIKPVFLIIAAGIYLISVIIPTILKNKIISLNKNVVESNSDLTKSCNEIFDGFTTIKSFNLMKLMLKLHCPVIIKTGKANMRLNFWLSVTNTVLAFLGILMTLLVFVIGGWLVVTGGLTAGMLIALAELLAYIIEPVTGIIGAQNSINSVKDVLGNCDQILAYAPKEVSSDSSEISFEGNINVNNLNYSYSGNGDKTLKNISFSFQKCKKYAIIGGNGSGKSTLLKVLAGLYEPQKGELSLSGHPYETISETSRREKMIYMEQNSFIFNLPIEENITLQHVITSSKLSNIMELLKLTSVAKLHGNENAYAQSLSGGEKQRISLARCLVKLSEAEVLIADEPTSAMDEDGQSTFNNIIDGLQNRTCVVVTHRLDNTLRIYDEILVMDNGMLVDCGTYDDLVNKGQIITHIPLAV